MSVHMRVFWQETNGGKHQIGSCTGIESSTAPSGTGLGRVWADCLDNSQAAMLPGC